MSPQELLATLRAKGFQFAAEGSLLAVRPASKLIPQERAAIAEHRAELLALLSGQPSQPLPRDTPNQPPLDHRLPCVCPEDVCWRCCNRPCEECGKPTGSAFIRTCYACGNRLASESMPDPAASRPPFS